MNKVKTKTEDIKAWIHDHKDQIAIIGTGITCGGLGMLFGYKKGYKKIGSITTIKDPFTGAVILTKRFLNEKECYELADICLNNGYNILSGLAEIDMLR